MKKFYAIALVAMAALSANAQNGAPLYATGGTGFDPQWNPSAPLEFTYADGAYTLKVNGLTEFKISTAKSETADEWDAFNAGCLTCAYGDTPGAVVALTAGDANIATPWKGDYTITVAGDLSTIKLETETKKPEGGATIYFRGDMNGWLDGGLEDAWKFTTKSETEYVFTCAEGQAVEAGITFKIADADWSAVNFGGEPDMELDMEYVMNYNGSNASLAEEWNGTCVFNITAPRANATVEFKSEKDPEAGFANIQVENNAVAEYYNLQGVRVANPENGLYIVVKGGKAVKQIIK